MKNRTILFGIFVACFLILMLPNISAVEYTTVKHANESTIVKIIESYHYLLKNAKEKEEIFNLSLSQVVIILAYIIGFILSIGIGVLTLNKTDSFFLTTIVSVIPIWLALMITKNLVETQTGWYIAVTVYILICMILGLIVPFIEKIIENNPQSLVF
jgi:hypothetical protein